MGKGKRQRKKTSVRPAAPKTGGISGTCRFSVLIFASLILAVTFFTYHPALSADFVNWDDKQVVVENSFIRSFSPFSLKWMFTTFHTGNYIPFTWIIHAAAYRLWKLDAGMHHLVNVLFHCVNAGLLFFLFRKILALAKQDRYALCAAGFGALLWSINPTHVESVAWISELKDVSCASFFLLSAIFYLRYAHAPKKRVSLLILTACFFTVSFLFKPMAVTFPAVMLVLDFWPLGRFRRKENIPGVLKEKIPFFGISAAFCVVAFKAQAASEAVVSVASLPFAFRIMNALHSVVFYLQKTLVPAGLAPFYPIIDPAHTAFAPKNLIALIVVALISALCVISRKKRPYLAAGWMFYIVTLLPVLGIVQVGAQSAADRYTYIPSMSVVLLLASLITALQVKLDRRYRSARSFKPVFAAFGVVLVVFGMLTMGQIGVWKDSVSLWEHCAYAYPGVSPKVCLNLGMAYKKSGRRQEAIEMLNKAILIRPDYTEAYSNLGYAYAEEGRYDEAIRLYRKALALEPRHVEAYVNFGNTYVFMEQPEKAISMFKKVLEIDPANVKAYVNLGNVYSSAGRFVEGIGSFEKAISLEPYNAYAYTNLGNAYSVTGRREDAIAAYRKSIKIDPAIAKTYYNLGCVYRDAGRDGDAIESFKKTIRADPKNTGARVGLAAIYYESGQYRSAARYYKEAIRLGAPADREFMNALEFSLRNEYN